MALSSGQLTFLIIVFLVALIFLYSRHNRNLKLTSKAAGKSDQDVKDGKGDKGGKLLEFGTALTVFSILFGVLTFYLNNEAKNRQTMMEQRRHSMVNIEEMFMSELPYLSTLYREMYATDPSFMLPVVPPPDPKIELVKERHAAFRVFQAISDVIEDIERGVLVSWNTDWNFRWILLWRTWFRSPRLRYNWTFLRQFFSVMVQHFVEENIISAEDLYAPIRNFRFNRFLQNVRRII